MSKIRIKNFGPIKEGYLQDNGWIDIKKVTVFIGNQGSGKSTVAKLISTFSWLEKSFYRGDFTVEETTPHSFLKHFKFQGIEDYFQLNSELEYIGSKYHFFFKRKGYLLKIEEYSKRLYSVPKIMYIPAERNFLSTIEDAFSVTGLPDHLFAFAEELKKAQKQLLNGKVDLPINTYIYEYDKQKEVSYISGNNHRVNLLNASSGFQSIVPLFLVTRFLTNQVLDKKMSQSESLSVNQSIRMSKELTNITLDSSIPNNEKLKKIHQIQSKFINKSLLNIIEEPEQNLFPSSQRLIINSLVGYSNRTVSNKLIITTHSPYIINYLTLSVKAYYLYNMLSHISSYESGTPKSKLIQIVPYKARINPMDLAIYELDEKQGTLTKLKDYKGLPSDENYLNSSLEDSNELYSQLQEIEKGWR